MCGDPAVCRGCYCMLCCRAAQACSVTHFPYDGTTRSCNYHHPDINILYMPRKDRLYSSPEQINSHVRSVAALCLSIATRHCNSWRCFMTSRRSTIRWWHSLSTVPQGCCAVLLEECRLLHGVACCTVSTLTLSIPPIFRFSRAFPNFLHGDLFAPLLLFKPLDQLVASSKALGFCLV